MMFQLASSDGPPGPSPWAITPSSAASGFSPNPKRGPPAATVVVVPAVVPGDAVVVGAAVVPVSSSQQATATRANTAMTLIVRVSLFISPPGWPCGAVVVSVMSDLAARCQTPFRVAIRPRPPVTARAAPLAQHLFDPLDDPVTDR